LRLLLELVLLPLLRRVRLELVLLFACELVLRFAWGIDTSR
jgi:hypothetical protein